MSKNKIANDILMHYGVKRRSGRYPWGSGDHPFQHSGDFLSRVKELKQEGMTEKEIAEELEYSTTELRVYKSVANHEKRLNDIATAKSLKAHGLNNSQIAREMGINESSVRSLLNEEAARRTMMARQTADILKKAIDEKGAIDVGAGIERELGVSRIKLEEALTILDAEGYSIHGIGLNQVTNPNQQTNLMVACKKDISQSDLYKDPSLIKSISDYHSEDGGKTFEQRIFHYPTSISSKRVQVNYAEDGGIKKDGVIELRRGVPDISLGDSNYAQVRILVDGTHYLKGMAMYSDDLPKGVDVRFNTNKTKDISKMDTFKEIHTEDPDNPFGSAIKANGQSWYTDKDGNKRLSAINKVREEGDWDTWSKTLSSQFLSKQNKELIKKQLELTYADNEVEYQDICNLTNPTVKRVLLQKFADECDSSAVHLKAAALPRQKAQVILPIPSLKDNEIYAPNFRNGERVALIRYPHGGTFEIPILTVNNKQKDAKKILGNAYDAVGINEHNAGKLSGADFDGDTVVVIPTNSKVRINATDSLLGLEDFEPKSEYGHAKVIEEKDGNKTIKRYFDYTGREFQAMHNTQNEMGRASNLITDMTIKGATDDELARAVRYSMVVIDAEKHGLDYKRAYLDNDISALKEKYQKHFTPNGRPSYASSTLISRASAETEVPKRKGSPRIDPETGKKIFKLANETYVDKTGKTRLRTQKSTQMADTDDARTLSSGYLVEEYYADYANKMKALGNKARKESLATGRLKYKKESKDIYEKEVKSLNAKLSLAELNAPRERQAQILATSVVRAKKAANPELATDKDILKKTKQQALESARISVGASGKDTRIKITDKEWEAIQAGAISDSKLTRILTKTEIDEIRKKATPRDQRTLSTAQVNKIIAMNASGYTLAEIADALGVSTSTVSAKIKEH